ncbi:hypothetical protein [Ruminococcus sp.]|uniref:hypothetical protein n=1 Tax=Ruminococcus sp. TaxID=41978 RepID=UPI0025CC68BB|nr:hypothetical protein [Ruminococcus sp.]MBQ8966164.1 hypothetical protein [Ruminococcus sp.]
MTFLAVMLMLAAIIGLPVGGAVYLRHRRDKKLLRKISVQVKNDLLSPSGYGQISPDVMAMIKGHMLKSHVFFTVISWAVLAVIGLIGRRRVYLSVLADAALVFAAAAAIHLAFALHTLAD